MTLNKYIKIRIIDSLGGAREVISPDPISGVVREIPFRLDKSEKRDPDKGEITLFNLAPDVIAFAQTDAEQIEVYASAETDPPPLLFKGEVTDVVNDKTDDFLSWVTRIYFEDSKSVLRTRIIARQFSPGTPVATMFNDLAAAASLQGDAQVNGALIDPFAALCPPRDAIAQACRRLGLRYQIVGQRLIVRNADKPVSNEVPLVSAETGLIGIPTSELDKKRVKVKFRSILNPKLVPGGLCVLKTKATTGSRKAPIVSGGTYWIERAVHVTGEKDTAATECVCRVYQ
jgi:hypothetical protein